MTDDQECAVGRARPRRSPGDEDSGVGRRALGSQRIELEAIDRQLEAAEEPGVTEEQTRSAPGRMSPDRPQMQKVTPSTSVSVPAAAALGAPPYAHACVNDQRPSGGQTGRAPSGSDDKAPRPASWRTIATPDRSKPCWRTAFHVGRVNCDVLRLRCPRVERSSPVVSPTAGRRAVSGQSLLFSIVRL